MLAHYSFKSRGLIIPSKLSGASIDFKKDRFWPFLSAEIKNYKIERQQNAQSFNFNCDKQFQCSFFTIDAFFKKQFPDFYDMMPDLVGDYKSHPLSDLVIIRCYPWVKENWHRCTGVKEAGITYEEFIKSEYGIPRMEGLLTFMEAEDWTERLPEMAEWCYTVAKTRFLDFNDVFPDLDWLEWYKK